MTALVPQPISISVPRALTCCLLLGLSLLGGCVTETTGGFNAEKSPQQALVDYIQLATGYLNAGDLLNAKRHLANASNLDPNNSEVVAIWGLVYSREGEDALADENFRRALRLNSGNSQARNNYAAFLFSRERYREAYEQLERVVQDTEYVARPQAFENLGLAALRLGRTDAAEYAFGRALQLNGRLPRASLELASLSFDHGAVPQAEQYYHNYLTLLQLYNLGQDARSLWLGIRLEHALGNANNVQKYGGLLAAGFSASMEYQQYLQLLDTLNDE